ncbi:uncharacterized protein NFIA_014710 [Aspergillus fischeri NRRL 181]|uniref:Uncharacterized protein n=1 Tax=Neosartorya fischeri (strain ATCC 1020 / DSM 3700 / CBS 544.65 / FGSC A1164 / JCM 1740 / NRRL 181 / WB 181) TaxID=331117 RepID=A1D2Y6_NEOFI|nr:uncharacterized protein NFIA_014710 [Aspergillus fischeri NRRL 181]EAW22779.1 hypothetical protein NFIA_014710 [Aspergillus fischeri NRRL 181]KAG2022065.1 hypothetical protein GB937_004159 [Aspergillus fischeri]
MRQDFCAFSDKQLARGTILASLNATCYFARMMKVMFLKNQSSSGYWQPTLKKAMKYLRRNICKGLQFAWD